MCVCVSVCARDGERERERALTYPSNADVTKNMDPVSVIWVESKDSI